MNQKPEFSKAPPVPDKISDWVRKIKAERTLNDMVEDLHRGLVDESPQYRDLLRATYDIHAVTGSLSFDNCLAAQMIQKKAKDNNTVDVANEKLAVINLALGVVLRRYHMSRKQRRNTVGGEEVKDNDVE